MRQLLPIWLLVSGAVHGSGFLVTDLPKGKSITRPRPATTIVPLSTEVLLTSTDMPQSLKFSSNSKSPIRVTVYDAGKETARHLDLKSGMTHLYLFKGLGSIRVRPSYAGSAQGLHLMIESDKPLKVTR